MARKEKNHADWFQHDRQLRSDRRMQYCMQRNGMAYSVYCMLLEMMCGEEDFCISIAGFEKNLLAAECYVPVDSLSDILIDLQSVKLIEKDEKGEYFSPYLIEMLEPLIENRRKTAENMQKNREKSGIVCQTIPKNNIVCQTIPKNNIVCQTIPKNNIVCQTNDTVQYSTVQNSRVENKKQKQSKPKKQVSKFVFSTDSHEMILSQKLYDLIKLQQPRLKEPNLQAWSKDFDSILRLDGFAVSEIHEMLDFVFSPHDGFSYVIESPKNLRGKMNKILLVMGKNEIAKKPAAPVTTVYSNDFDTMFDEAQNAIN